MKVEGIKRPCEIKPNVPGDWGQSPLPAKAFCGYALN